MIVRLSQLKIHPAQRPISHDWVTELFENHFDGGKNLQKASFPLVVLAVGPEDVNAISNDNRLSRAPEDREFLLISGQHRVEALKHIILSRLTQFSRNLFDESLLDDPEAEWPAVVYSQSESHKYQPALCSIRLTVCRIRD
jgi:hypothetical protein